MDISLTEKARIKNQDYNFMYCLIKVGRSRMKCDTRVIAIGKPRPIRTSSDVVYGICRGLPSARNI